MTATPSVLQRANDFLIGVSPARLPSWGPRMGRSNGFRARAVAARPREEILVLSLHSPVARRAGQIQVVSRPLRGTLAGTGSRAVVAVAFRSAFVFGVLVRFVLGSVTVGSALVSVVIGPALVFLSAVGLAGCLRLFLQGLFESRSKGLQFVLGGRQYAFGWLRLGRRRLGWRSLGWRSLGLLGQRVLRLARHLF